MASVRSRDREEEPVEQQKKTDKNEGEGRSIPVNVCIRNGWGANGWAGQHKYFWWKDDTFTGMGSSTKEPSPKVALEGDNLEWGRVMCECYWVDANTEKELKRIAAKKKEVADQKYLGVVPTWKPYTNDCHTLVDDSLKEANLPPTELGRFSGESAEKYDTKKCVIQ
jgi:hypothetical protein